jgi:uncharacterized membrane protein YphA (DoxX/SURF4 family)
MTPADKVAPAAASGSTTAVRVFMLLVRLALGAIFAYAGYVKLRDPWQLFAMGIDSYQILPLRWVEITARVLPWIELLLGGLLISGRWLRVSGTLVSLMLLGFMTLMVRAYAKGMQINCGCFGPGEVISWKTLLRDGSMVAAAIAMTCLAFLKRPKTA